MDLIEINEAFGGAGAVAPEGDFGSWLERLAQALDHVFQRQRLGHLAGPPGGATGVRIMTTLLHEMRRRGARYGLETMCIGGGQASPRSSSGPDGMGQTRGHRSPTLQDSFPT